MAQDNSGGFGVNARVAVILFPGTNCEDETIRSVNATGLHADLIRWNQHLQLGRYAAYILPGGWSYEDRVRAGAIAAHDDLMDLIRQEASRGKPILGICNGAQVLLEAKLICASNGAALALAPNRWGYRCAWTKVQLTIPPSANVFTSTFTQGEVFDVPIAHGEGRFTASDPQVFSQLQQNGQIPLIYVDPAGQPATTFPWNPNGALMSAAGISNTEGNILAFMPHPERASWWLQHSPQRRPAGWQARPDRFEMLAPAHRIFSSLATYVQQVAHS